MNTHNLLAKFSRIGARLKVVDRPSHRFRVRSGAVSLDIREDRDGEYFEVACLPGVDSTVTVLDAKPSDRHLLLLVRQGGEKQKFLCGHDERHWFVAAVPEAAPVGTVGQAKEALKPPEVQVAQNLRKLGAAARNRRKNVAYRRQGEWFFLPVVAGFHVEERRLLRNEPLRRANGSKPHWVQCCYRTGGETVYVCRHHPNGVTANVYERILAAVPHAKTWRWQAMRRNMDVFVRGRVRHPDHKTIVLHGWHRVLMNTEREARAMRNVAFLD
jgi:hypothetical protein